ncbi:MAG TPA: hypothetical protein PLD23_01270 [Armatimonadota bacterium]|nr:hypothetical protein [Armatimonadota bacterium]
MTITHRIPEPVMNGKVAGARCEALGRALTAEIVVVLGYLAGSRRARG